MIDAIVAIKESNPSSWSPEGRLERCGEIAATTSSGWLSVSYSPRAPIPSATSEECADIPPTRRDKLMKLAIGISCLDSVATPHYISLLSLAFEHRIFDPKLRKSVEKISLLVQQGNIIPDSRRAIAEQAIALGASHLWFIDSDIVVTPSVLNTLISHHKDVVVATYRSRYNEHLPLGNRDLSAPYSGSGPLPMATVPLGCALIKTSVFAALERPWFNYELGDAPGKVKDISEDSWFCRQCRRAGIAIFMDPSLTVGHVGMEIF